MNLQFERLNMKYNIEIGISKTDDKLSTINIEKLTVPTGDLPYFIEFNLDEDGSTIRTTLDFGNTGERIIDFKGKEGWILSYGQKTGRIYFAQLPADKIKHPKTNIRRFLKNVLVDNEPSRFNGNIAFGSKLLKTVISRMNDKASPTLLVANQ